MATWEAEWSFVSTAEVLLPNKPVLMRLSCVTGSVSPESAVSTKLYLVPSTAHLQHSGGWSRTRVQRVCKIQLGLNPSVCLLSIEGEYVPVEGDEVSYKVCCIPPKLEKIQAVEVTITHLKPGTKHETWSGRTVDSWTPEPRWWEGRGVGGVSMIGGAGWKNEVRGG